MNKPIARIKISDVKIAYDSMVALEYDGECMLQGNTIALVGHNGAGKSTFIKAVLGLLDSSTGSIESFWSTNNGESFSPITAQEDMAFCPESGSVFRDITVESYIKLWCRLKCSHPKYYKREGSKFIELLDVESLMSKYGRELSKGQRRRVQTAVGFIIQPKLFLIDEPFDGLDVQRTHELGEIIRSQSTNISFIVSSHRMDVMERISDFVIVLKDGKFAHYGTLSKVTRELGGSSYTIEVDGVTGDELALKLNKDFPDSVITRHGLHGSILTLTKKDSSIEDLRHYFSKSELPPPRIDEFEPSLVDSMTLHLKQ